MEDIQRELELMTEEDNRMYLIIELEAGRLVRCDDCGNIWDGNAQCNCWQWQDFDEELTETSDYDPIIYGADPTSVVDILKYEG
jgi:hypothetical protein